METTRITSLLQQAVGLQQQGRFAQAEELYRQVLQLQPDNFDALHLSGVLARQTGRPQAALDLIRQAIQINPHQAAAYCNAGAALQDLQRPQEALASYDQALQIRPDYALALNNRGNALRNLLRYDEALASYQQAIAVKPDYAEAYNNHGSVLHRQHRYEAALLSYRRALQLNPVLADAWNNQGIALHALHAYEDAVASYEQALLIKPDYAEAYCNRGMALQKLRRFQQALDSYEQTLRLQPQYANAHVHRADSLRALGRNSEAIAAYRKALEHGANAGQINYALAALGAAPAPAASPAAYVKELFDQYAGHFEQHLLQGLQYRTPALLVDAVRQTAREATVPATPAAWNIVDLGCGTGLCGPLLKPLAGRLVGVDISPNMLEQAAQKGLYDELVYGEIAGFLRQQRDCYDLVLAADVFVYIGDLAEVFAGARQGLKSGGIFGFSVEESDGDDIVLRASRRFAHSPSYLRKMAQEYGFILEKMDRCAIRQDEGQDVYGYLLVMRCVK
ncbi:MAG: tetratricopeptide repeat protein [Pseudomonadota bacterium]